MPKSPEGKPTTRRIRLRGHEITAASAAIGAGILISGSVAAQAVDDTYEVINRQVPQRLGNLLANDDFVGEARIEDFNFSSSVGVYENTSSEVFFNGLSGPSGCGVSEDSFIYLAKSNISESSSATVRVSLLPPVAADEYQVSAGGVLSGDVQDNDPLPPDAKPEPNAISIVSFSSPSNGSVEQTSPGVINRTGEFEYTPDPGFSGEDSFVYQSQDTVCDWNTNVDVLVLPVATPDTIRISGGAETCAISVLSNDLGSNLSVIGLTQPTDGTASISADDTLCFSPDQGFLGVASFAYEIRDGAGSTASGTVQVQVDNDPPIVQDESFETRAAQSLAGNVLANDSDPNGDDLSVSNYGQPSNGTVVGQPDGNFTYTPAAGFSGSDRFEYTVADTANATSTGSASILVVPVANDKEFFEPAEGRTFRGNLLDNDDGTDLRVVGNTQPEVGVLQVQSDGTFEYTPPPSFSGSVSFQYTVADAEGNQATATVTLGSITAVPIPVSGGGALGFLAVLLGWLGLRRLR
ncbi:MAG: Ig-like domain-containing protein [Wenzhouxiangella sp.]